MTEKFQTIVSKVNKTATYSLMGIMWIAIIMIIMVIGTVFENMYNNISQYFENDLGTFSLLVIALFLLILCCLALILALTNRKKGKIRKAIINEKGVTFYDSRDNIINTILYSELQQSINLSHDAYMYSTTSRYPKSYLNVFLRNKAGESILTSIDFNFEYVLLSNQIEMYRQFLIGIQYFRPDLKISQQTIKEYDLSPDSPPMKKYEKFDLFISAFIFLVGLGLIYVLILLVRILF
ncbi:hypothetical protein [Chryseobacterium sp. BIGb0232]|uniref:hypothetical protein n=1 Tax=Chryseobacterium sp. BIGb0232 TaxID=2940598 RepID=UPI000F48BAC6|nr:hypothetical protein [Chryseobacterium sp. BIGb0232]MCS4302214.1 protein-S-isoprenylcysteine O-methyltransferase Ste14 [Chryseobacterium sp. BIGb0232]ROS18159.1 hypothetical protein EDF65_2551 [Chryseobacterium nakagawai]